MILVTVGLHPAPFDRLVRAADGLATRIDEQVIIQYGAATYVPQFAQHVDFVDDDQMARWLSKSRILVSHAGAGTILDALHVSKPLVLVPRMARYGEHIDDHQLELAEALAERRRAVSVSDPSADALLKAIAEAGHLGQAKMHDPRLHDTLRDWLSSQATWRSRRRHLFDRRPREE